MLHACAVTFNMTKILKSFVKFLKSKQDLIQIKFEWQPVWFSQNTVLPLKKYDYKIRVT